MCGIFGYIGEKEAISILIEGLKKLEYRGYDSAGIVVFSGKKLSIEKSAGKITELENILSLNKIKGRVGLGHTRWATHGIPSKENAHPHLDCSSQIAVVHNGIIENFSFLRKDLINRGHKFSSQTDTEIIAHLIEENIKLGLEKSVKEALKRIRGSYALGVLYKKEPNKIIVARSGSPLIIGIGENENFIASDIPAIIKYTSKIKILEDGDIAEITKDSVKISSRKKTNIERKEILVSWDPVSAERGGYAHFMLKEIHEQPKAIKDTISEIVDSKRENISFKNFKISDKDLNKINRIVLTSCGTSWHAALIGEYFLEQFARIPTDVEYAAEFRYRSPIIDKNTLVIAISQSGETADTLGAIETAKKSGARTLAICNVLASTIARECESVIYTIAGPEIGVASTKAFTTQIVVLYLLALFLGAKTKKIGKKILKSRINDLFGIPQGIEKILAQEEKIEEVAEKYSDSTNALYLGRGEGFPIALEGALKLKEISYIHAEGYPAAEMKHGPIALIDKNMPVVVLALKGRRYEKIIGNIEEVNARGGKIIAIATEGDRYIKKKASEVIFLPKSAECLSPIMAVVPLQLLAYYIAVMRNCHVDQPRNLAKSVTVE